MLLALLILVGKYVLEVLVLGFECFPHANLLRVFGLKLQMFEANSVDGEHHLLLRDWEGACDKAARRDR
jgi:hypothetical protein